MEIELYEIIKSYGCDNILKGNIKPNRWISCKYKAVSFSEAWEPAQKLLADYIKGDNASKAAVVRHYPIVVEVKPSGGPYCESTFVVRMVVPQDAPKPSSTNLDFDHFSVRTVLVRPFQAQNIEEEFREESIHFAETLDTVGLKFVPDSYFWVMYPESEHKQGRAQIWFEAKE